MFKNYWKTAFRSLWKNKQVAFINVFGLATGIACSLLIFLFVQDEKSYDRFNKDSANIHRVVKDFINDDGSRIPDATTPTPLAPAMQRDIPEILQATRIHPDWGRSVLIKYRDKKIMERKVWRVDSTFFNIFTFPFIRGNALTALNDAKSIVLTETAAKRYFGNEDPIGKILLLDRTNEFKVTGIIKDVPTNAHFHFDFLLSFKVLPAQEETNWGSYNYYTYIKVKDGTDMNALTKKIQSVYERNQAERFSVFYTQPLTDIHLSSHLKWELEANGDKLYVNIFSLIAFFILLIAAINYINLSTAKASIRAKEIGIRKVAGAQRRSLILQFLLESVIISSIASLIALLIAYSLIPFVNDLTQKQLSIMGTPVVITYLSLIALGVGLVAGIFPSLYLSAFKPVSVLKGWQMNERGTLNLRKSLVIVQFSISIALIIGALIIAQQMNFLQSAKLGFDIDKVLVVKNTNHLTRSQQNNFLKEIRQLTGVKNAATSSNIIGNEFSTSRLSRKGSDKEQQLNFITVGFDFQEVMGIQLKEGRGFSSDYQSDTLNNGVPEKSTEKTVGGIVINERAVKEFGLDSPAVGKQLVWGRDRDTMYYINIVGIAKDFHFTSLRNEIKPFGFVTSSAFQSNVTVKLSTENIRSTLSKLEGVYNRITGQKDFEYVFLDESFSKLYSAESRFQKVFISLVIIGIIISCLGLFGLATFSAEQRIKEIGIRKVLGASVTNLVGLLSKDYLKLIVVSLFIAIPVSWYAMNNWLQDFAYRIHIQWWVFLAAALIAFAIALLTISFQAIRAALLNPVISLRTE